jgi:FRG domain
VQIGKTTDTPIDSVSSFVSHVGSFERRHIAQWFFRGHPRSEYRLVAGLFRLQKVLKESFANWDDLESFLLLAFKREAAQYVDSNQLSEEDWLCLAQHHRLPTRLLDWTTNPLIALYFAVEADYQNNADVWCLGFPSTNNCLEEGTFFSQRTTLIKEGFIHFPRYIDERIVNQGGCFTVHKSAIPLNEESEYNDFLTFNRIVVPSSAKKSVRAELYDMGIHAAFIYPGLDSLASRLVYELTETHFRYTCLPQ